MKRLWERIVRLYARMIEWNERTRQKAIKRQAVLKKERTVWKKQAKQKNQIKAGVGIGCIAIIIVFAIFFWAFSSDSPEEASTPETNTPKTQEQIHKEQIEEHFSAWDGSHRGLTELIKKSMNDPGSYEHAETAYWDKGDHLIVKTTFRGKNAFGSLVKNWVKAKVDLNGNVIEVIEQGP